MKILINKKKCIIVLHLILIIRPIESLRCYQCTSTSIKPKPDCLAPMIYHLNDTQDRDIWFDCPSRRSTFCVRSITYSSTYNQTIRGCLGKKDSGGAVLNEGCMTLKNGTEVCLCTRDLCNFSYVLKARLSLTTLSLFLQFIWILNNSFFTILWFF